MEDQHFRADGVGALEFLFEGLDAFPPGRVFRVAEVYQVAVMDDGPDAGLVRGLPEQLDVGPGQGPGVPLLLIFGEDLHALGAEFLAALDRFI